ncbi:hypothetical protein ACFSBZ_06755 [Amnibacterium flavum]|uniref:Uncharacterized protein n=1 Tax=Amnibacterium flavum TaxID=2173173 RepID=A0A2V1HN05_9MICO|nr:hypothetical protein [Amnibacterium flavum]PVZ93855.1 hypothetical protein DDQ50_08720 [Amnibacterium flavum]
MTDDRVAKAVSEVAAMTAEELAKGTGGSARDDAAERGTAPLTANELRASYEARQAEDAFLDRIVREARR